MKTQVLLEHAAKIVGAPLNVYARGEGDSWSLLGRYGASAEPLPDEIRAFGEANADGAEPSLVSVDNARYYAVISLDEAVCLLGPVHLSASLALKNNFTLETQPGEADAASAVCDIPVFLNTVLLLYNFFAEEPITEQALLERNGADRTYLDVQKYNAALVYDNRENSQKHNSYSQERRLMGCIERGDLEMLEKCQQERITGSFGKLAGNMDRSVRNISIAAIALSSRAAIQGGVNPEIAFSLCDSYIMKLEALRDLRELQPLVESAQRNFTSMVKRLGEESSQQSQRLTHPLIEKSKDYIHAHLHGKITVGETAVSLRTNPNYLSTLFKRHEGISFSDYVMREKIALAKNLLIYSPSSYGEIAATLGFSSQSHMGKHFKSLTGMTPIQFRKRYGVTD